jgi:hypothetical protein
VAMQSGWPFSAPAADRAGVVQWQNVSFPS